MECKWFSNKLILVKLKIQRISKISLFLLGSIRLITLLILNLNRQLRFFSRSWELMLHLKILTKLILLAEMIKLENMPSKIQLEKFWTMSYQMSKGLVFKTLRLKTIIGMNLVSFPSSNNQSS